MHTPTPNQTQRRAASKRKQVLEAVQYLYATRQRPITAGEIELACRESINHIGVVEAIKGLLNDGQLVHLARGVYAPAQHHSEPRPISLTMLHDGTSKLEIGDTIVELGPMEHRTLVRLLGGVSAEAAQLAAESTFMQRMAITTAKVERTEELLSKLSDFLRKQ